MIVRVLYFGGLRERVTRVKHEQVEIGAAATVTDLLRELTARYPSLDDFRECVRVAVNEEFVTESHPLGPDDEVALVPPVAGGADDLALPFAVEPWCRLMDGPIDVGEVVRAVAGPGHGAVVTFVGLVRDNNDGHDVVQLEYEAYTPMVLRSLADITRRCEAAYPGARVAVAHRTGVLAVGDIAVVIAVAAPHRVEAFGASRMCIEELKQETPIWKKETSTQGDTWIGMTP